MRKREQVALWAYLGAANLLVPPLMLVALPLLLLKQKRRATFFRRLGLQQLKPTDSGRRPLWVHALSLGETLSCIPLVIELKRRMPERPLAFSVSTHAAMDIARKRLGSVAEQLLYFPYDLWWSDARFLRRLNPELAVFVETDIWPGFQYQLRRRRIQSVMVNGRLSPSTYASCRRWKKLFSPALNTFERIYPQSAREAARYVEVGVQPERIARSGNLKFDVASRAPDEHELDSLRSRLGLNPGQAVLLAGSTHPGEEGIVLRAFAEIRGQFPSVKLILVPRHPARSDEVIRLASVATGVVSRFSTLNQRCDWHVLVVDVMGVLSKLYHLATIAFVGGSIVRKGGQNPIEAAAAACPVLFGPDMTDFPDIASWLLERGAAIRIQDAGEMRRQFVALLESPSRRKRMGECGHGLVAENSGATEQIVRDMKAALQS